MLTRFEQTWDTWKDDFVLRFTVNSDIVKIATTTLTIGTTTMATTIATTVGTTPIRLPK